ncbi:MAG: tRNA lysidine(34) synthetase TilS [Desulfobulbus sp.]|uniref:tRNA lysidine(34) synthetase TilS n=1 Tax=uncultured Desulfobulbus sp. TaxID=239745 RepID=UPI001B414A68|nr:tRNA lysidine(34) synthetase TilS [uncultured Desulfobulbus sp.]MBP7518285.1 tRNA lysidine(34) synthetase TilS [Desulfobulbus sp.]
MQAAAGHNHPLEQNLRRTLLAQPLLDPGSRVLVGVSGGADSMALVHLLAALRQEFRLTLVAAYVDHGLRPEETPAERACVQAAADRLGIGWETTAVDVSGHARAERMSLEHAARELRYRALADIGRRLGCDRLAVGHTADDQVEEVLLRLLRGAGRKGLAGMGPRSGWVIRPLLGVRKAELLAYLGDREIVFCTDSSNADLRFLRNRIRHHLLPLLETDYDPGVRSALAKTAANLGADEDLLAALVDEHWRQTIEWAEPAAGRPAALLRRAPFCALHPALQRRLVERLLWRVGDTARYAHILAVTRAAQEGRSGSELHLSRGLRVTIGRDALRFTYPRGQGPWRGRLGPV